MSASMKKIAVIAGAGPAGLTAAYELLKQTDVIPIVCEKSDIIGGISQTYNYKGNGIDIGGHRFFSKSDRVIEWWTNILPIQKVDKSTSGALSIFYHGKSHTIDISANDAPDPEQTDEVMLIRNRKSRILFNGRFIPYPMSLNLKTIHALGWWGMVSSIISYIRYAINPIKPEQSLKDFLVNRFGFQLYKRFFASYTEKVWGLPCEKISAEWGKQRIKGISIAKVLRDIFGKIFFVARPKTRKTVETSLIEYFLYPKYGPGQMWKKVAKIVEDSGGIVRMNNEITEIDIENNQVRTVTITDTQSKKSEKMNVDYFFSSMSVKQLIASITTPVPPRIQEIATRLPYRDFVIVGVLLSKMHNIEQTAIDDNWIYIQEKHVFVGRMQFFHNWSPYLIHTAGQLWVGLEYFCSAGDHLSRRTDEEMKALAVTELKQLGMIDDDFVLDMCVLRVPKAYPAYFGSYDRLHEIKKYTDSVQNLFLIGRNGMHKYNNQDHSMLSAMEAVSNIKRGITTKENIWSVNTEEEYHEHKNN